MIRKLLLAIALLPSASFADNDFKIACKVQLNIDPSNTVQEGNTIPFTVAVMSKTQIAAVAWHDGQININPGENGMYIGNRYAEFRIPGSYTLEIRAKDISGNVAICKSDVIRVVAKPNDCGPNQELVYREDSRTVPYYTIVSETVINTNQIAMCVDIQRRN